MRDEIVEKALTSSNPVGDISPGILPSVWELRWEEVDGGGGREEEKFPIHRR